ncbi:MAG: preprotein translocase subunit SecA [Pelagibacterales bacterium]|nr:preprotein translocase subunit SecA [Pelagibacterales bacterium]OUU61583.1 MAG: preprotein translocase subunit SecA [Alphaproteobacteria bacterium TMED62]
MLNFLKNNFFINPNKKTLNTYTLLLNKINGLENDIKLLTDLQIKNKTNDLKEQLEKGKTLNDILPEAFALVREAAVRTLGQRHYDVQILGGVALHKGKIAEMKTGEGKTLVSTLSAYLNAIGGLGVHVVTVNDYLASRDSEWMGVIFKFLGLSVGCIKSGMSDIERKNAYMADITYGTNNEFGFDYLRDNMKFNLEDMCQRNFNYAIIDEVDSILIDEARTPLVISGAVEDNTKLYLIINDLVKNLDKKNFEIDEKSRSINLNSTGIENFEKLLYTKNLLSTQNLYAPENISILHHINQALKANFLFTKDKDYLVKDNQVVIVDEFTGRMMEGRRFADGLHQAIEAKENVKIQNENQTLASVTFQNYFRMYPKLSGMTGTAKTEAAEFSEIYGLDVLEIPPHKNMVRKDLNDEIYRTDEEKWQAVVKEISTIHEKGQPLLVGTTNIKTSELISKRLKRLNIKHEVLNARFHEKEAKIISQAGKPYAVTIATNMAGRGTDIQLGGNNSDLDNNKDKVKNNQSRALQTGGLFVLGTERHESRRIDNQLRGRSGRQGDPGTSKFFISLEDDLMRIFGSERLDNMLKKLGLKDGESIIHPWINKAIEKAQSKVEGRNFEIRKNLLKFDDVMNDQRKVVYEQRKELLTSNDINQIFLDMLFDTLTSIIEKNISEKNEDELDINKILTDVKNIFGINIADKEISDKSTLLNLLKKNISDKLNYKINLISKENFSLIQKQILVQVLDQQWKAHLLGLDQLRQGIGLRAYAQRDPLNEYKRESFTMFEQMLETVRITACKFIMLIEIETKGERKEKNTKAKTIRERLREKN